MPWILNIYGHETKNTQCSISDWLGLTDSAVIVFPIWIHYKLVLKKWASDTDFYCLLRIKAFEIVSIGVSKDILACLPSMYSYIINNVLYLLIRPLLEYF